MKKNLLFIFAAILFYTVSPAQFSIKNYPIDQFKLPDIDRQALEFSGNFFGDYNSRSNEDGHLSSSAHISPVASLLYSRYINRPNLQANYSAFFRPDLDISSTDNEFIGEKTNHTSFEPALDYSAQRLNYRDQHFTLVGAMDLPGMIMITGQPIHLMIWANRALAPFNLMSKFL
jgi:hypothetical protein